MAFASPLRSSRCTHTKRQGTRGPAVTFCVRSAAGAAGERCFPASPSPRSSQVDASPPRSWSTTIVQSASLSAHLMSPNRWHGRLSLATPRSPTRVITRLECPSCRGDARTAQAGRHRRCSEAPSGPTLVVVQVQVVEHDAEPGGARCRVPTRRRHEETSARCSGRQAGLVVGLGTDMQAASAAGVIRLRKVHVPSFAGLQGHGRGRFAALHTELA